MKAAIVSIGTEVTSGQILNSNAAKLAERLTDLGVTVVRHVSLQDEVTEISEGLTFATLGMDLTFVTGGLGPTSDDRTREALALWLKVPLFFHEPSWTHIEKILEARGRIAREIQKKQALFPTGSEILENSAGTANGFLIQKDSLRIFVLPGPPAEIEAIWNSGISAELLKFLPPKPVLLARWHCRGQPESTLAELTEELFGQSGLQIGYRLLAPLIEIKIWIPREQVEQFRPKLELLTSRLGESLVEKFEPK